MTSQRERMLSGELYRADDPELVAARNACQRLLEEFNASPAGGGVLAAGNPCRVIRELDVSNRVQAAHKLNQDAAES